MTELDDLVELMRGARGQWRTVRATLRSWQDVARIEEAWDRFAAQRPPGSVARLVPEDGVDDSVDYEAKRKAEPRFLVKELRVWARKPYRWRIETQTSNHTLVDVGDKAWRTDLLYYGMEEMEPPDLPPLDDTVAWVFDPRIVLSELDVRVVGRSEHAGREAVRVTGAAGEEMQLANAGPLITSVLATGPDDVELLVDAERGILLRSAARLDGEEFARIEVVKVIFDEDLPEDLFVAQPLQRA